MFICLVMFIGFVFCFNAFADTGCPIGYGYQAPMVFVGTNLNSAATIIGGISNTGEQISDSHYRTNNFTEIPVEVGKSYTITTNDSAQILLSTYDANHNFIKRVNVSDNNYVCDSGISYVVPVLYVNDENNWQFSVADTEILFFDTLLRKVGDYTDYIDYKNQQIVRNIGVKVFDGTESWQKGSASFYVDIDSLGALQSHHDCYYTHFEGLNTADQLVSGSNTAKLGSYLTNPYWDRAYISASFTDFPTVATFKSWLAEQYANGTPVTAYYPLATPVVENINLSSYTRYEMPVIDGDCSLCPPNTYKDFVGNEQCTPCPDRLISPSGAISVNECGRILHVGNYNAFMPVGRRTEHGLCTRLDGVKYCADLYERK